MSNDETCTYKQGQMNECEPLAVPYVPFQAASEPVYDSGDALANGTLFPGLDLPFMDYIAKSGLPNTPLTELMALDFVSHELALYLDTHKDDTEAFETWKKFAELAMEGQRRYVELYGPISKMDTAASTSWTWTNDPWPWDGSGKAASK